MEHSLIITAIFFYLYSLIMTISVQKKYNIATNGRFKELSKTTTNEDLKKKLRLISIFHWLSGLFLLLFFLTFIFKLFHS